MLGYRYSKKYMNLDTEQLEIGYARFHCTVYYTGMLLLDVLFIAAKPSSNIATYQWTVDPQCYYTVHIMYTVACRYRDSLQWTVPPR